MSKARSMSEERVNKELLESLREVTMLLKFALLSTTAEIAKEAKPFLDRADAAIRKATP